MGELLDWLDDLDAAWVVVMQAQVWDPVKGMGVDWVEEMRSADGEKEGEKREVKKEVMSQTERTRLRSLLVGGVAALEEWLAGSSLSVNGRGMEVDDDEEERGEGMGDEIETALERMGLQQGFDDLFSRTLADMGALAGSVSDPDGMRGTC
jgi:hypothetical protein